ncbi:DUF1439 domain-containing protein [Pandoraea sp.]|uniref:DUF1439 domain-containing protein n=1 Tax=Pandoraea sp. TaxID=1883445 RepID=UPI0011FEEDB8|nr:DUF1439 domain-containing protein [Pandoraea sp.]TAL52337.1 MAG: DUF1439 domain-containing protein [Pandoraea sp.]TAM16147.1 MAG: DUF1439 domain-containing protein [Pandoraea sp.]
MPRRRFLKIALGSSVLALAPLPALASPTFPFIPDHYTFSRAQVQAAVARKFPFHRAVPQVFSMDLTHPEIALQPAENRLALTVDAVISSPFMVPQTLNGTFVLVGGLAYNEATLSVVVRDPAVTQADFGPATAMYGQQIDMAANMLASQVLQNYPIYTFKPDQLTFAGVQFQPGTITVVPAGVRVEIVER